MINYFQIPIDVTFPSQQFQININGTFFTFNLHYNTRMQRWILDINDPSNNPILEGIPCLINRSLTGQYPTLQIPAAIFFAFDLTGQDTEPTQFSWGQTHALNYGVSS